MITAGPNLRYYTGVNSILLERPFLFFAFAEGEPSMVAPELEAGQYRSCPLKINICSWTDNEGPSKAFKELRKEHEISGRWGVEGRVPYLYLHHLLKHASPKLENAEPILQRVRETKDPEEVALMKRSARILSAAFSAIPGMMDEGMTEQELERRISQEIFLSGADRISDLLVQSGERSAYPHGLPSKRKIRRGDSVVIDSSSSHSGYIADITRTFVMGGSRELEDTYGRVLEAEEKAIRQARSGVTVGSVDAAARNYLRRKGLSKYFIHRTGHGLGLEVHEAPYIVDGGEEVLRPNMFFTIEPGVYRPGRYGVRVEDNVMSKAGGRDVITSTPKEYGWWR